MNYKYFI